MEEGVNVGDMSEGEALRPSSTGGSSRPLPVAGIGGGGLLAGLLVGRGEEVGSGDRGRGGGGFLRTGCLSGEDSPGTVADAGRGGIAGGSFLNVELFGRGGRRGVAELADPERGITIDGEADDPALTSCLRIVPNISFSIASFFA